MTDDLEELTVDPDQRVRRDRYGRYLVVPPEGGQPTGYTRATTVAKALDDTSNLMSWGKRMTALGLARRPDLLALVAAASPEDRTALNDICDRATEAGGATARRDLGTALHKLVERKCADPSYEVPEMYAGDVHAVLAAIDDAGYEVVVEFSEQVLVLDRHRIAGMCDLVLRHRTTGQLIVADLKTGASVKYGTLGFAIQLAIYAGADAVYVQGTAKDGSEDRRHPWPDVDLETAMILHAEPGSGLCTPYRLDIGRGAAALECAMAVREWRKEKELLVPFEPQFATNPVAILLDEDYARGIVETPRPEGFVEATSSPGEGGDVEGGAVASVDAIPPSPERQQWLLARIDAIKAAGGKATETLRLRIPVDCPGIPMPAAVRAGNATWTVEQQDAVAAMLTKVEALHELPFPGDDPAAERPESTFAQPVEARAGVRTLRPAADDGHAPDAAVEELRARIKAMPAHEREHVVGWARQAIDHDPALAWNMGEPPVLLRRYAIAAAAVELVQLVDFAPHEYLPRLEDDVRTALSLVLGDEALQETLPVGALLGALSIDEADRLATHRLALEDGTPRLIAAA